MGLLLKNRVYGFTLVEVMIGMVLALLVSIGVYSVYLSTSRGYIENENYAYTLESGRFALRTITEDLLMTDFWGRISSLDDISSSLSTAVGGCAEGIQLFAVSNALLFNNYHESPASEQFDPCPEIDNSRFANTDIIAIKRVASDPTAETFIDIADTDGDGNTSEVITRGSEDLQPGDVYLRTNGSAGNIINDASSGNQPATDYADWRYVPKIYFIRNYYESAGDGMPSLCRMSLVGNELGNEQSGDIDSAQCLVAGIEDMHLQFGIDSDDDGIVNHYDAKPGLSDMEKILTARIYLLARSLQPITGYVNDKTYNLGDVTIAANNDGFYRHVVSTTVNLRNTASINQFN